MKNRPVELQYTQYDALIDAYSQAYNAFLTAYSGQVLDWAKADIFYSDFKDQFGTEFTDAYYNNLHRPHIIKAYMDYLRNGKLKELLTDFEQLSAVMLTQYNGNLARAKEDFAFKRIERTCKPILAGLLRMIDVYEVQLNQSVSEVQHLQPDRSGLGTLLGFAHRSKKWLVGCVRSARVALGQWVRGRTNPE